MAAFPKPAGGASLLLSFRLQRKTIIVVGANALAASRAFSALEADSEVVVLAKGDACEELKWRAGEGEITLLDFDSLPGTSGSGSDRDAAALDAYLSNGTQHVAFVLVTDTLLGNDPTLRRSSDSAARIAQVCRARNIPINVTDIPELCDFSFTSTHRFTDSETGASTSLQVGVTTNGQGCRLAGRIRRDIVTKLSKDAGGAVARVGQLRSLAKSSTALPNGEVETELNDEDSVSTPNRPVPQRKATETDAEAARRRMKWVAQVSEYWPMSRLAKMTKAEMEGVLDGQSGLPASGSGDVRPPLIQHHAGDSEIGSMHALTVSPVAPPGRILLVGSGPGHPSLLTVATRDALTKHADLVLSDKLVPDAVLALIPPHVKVQIARKFPGNADGAQNELMEAAIAAAKQGLTVVRLKQGDPAVYGRYGEEVLYFRSHGYEPLVIPGVSSVLAGPTFAGIPVTQRGASEGFVVCTGVGRAGKEVVLPGYERGRTLVLLMGVARLPQLLETLQAADVPRRNGAAYPPHLPIAIIERASMPDQRVICSTLRDIAAALDSVGEQRPPGMLVIGWSILSLWQQGDVSVLDADAELRDEERVRQWLGDAKWRVTEGLESGWESL